MFTYRLTKIWNKPTAEATSALMRVCVGSIFLYRWLILGMDLQLGYIALPKEIADVSGLSWNIGLLGASTSPFWVWSLYSLALLIAILFLLGLATWLTGPLALFFHLVYMHYQSAMVTNLDGLLTVSLFYLSLMPCAKYLSFIPRRGIAKVTLKQTIPHPPKNHPLIWGNMMMRALQIHLCIIYFHSFLILLTTDFAFGEIFWSPLQSQKMGRIEQINWLNADQVSWIINAPKLMVFSIGIILFQILHPIFVWLPKLRVFSLLLAVVVHLGVGIILHTLLFNLLMLTLNLAFVSENSCRKFLSYFHPLLATPWMR